MSSDTEAQSSKFCVYKSGLDKMPQTDAINKATIEQQHLPFATSAASRCNSRSNIFRWRRNSFSFFRSSYLTRSLCCNLRASSCR